MTTITAEIIADSISHSNIRLTTMRLVYPRCIHAELMTHRVFSRNASSSRAIPVARMIRDVINDPFVPLHWGANQSGMQARQELTGWRKRGMVGLWHTAKWLAVGSAWTAMKLGAHKQLVNRLLEPFGHITVLVTSTDWANFFALRNHPDAEPHIQMLAQAMQSAMAGSQPRFLETGEWHLPFAEVEKDWNDPSRALKCSVARCARVSYNNHDGSRPSVRADIKLHDKLLTSVPLHASPAEHQAMAVPKVLPSLQSNLRGWVQYRKRLQNECVRDEEFVS